ncbi:DNA repair protein RecO [Spirulina sp. CS-785/01]|uniref:DNA repair protein RecO n=1 Tax=Spirulina sp. CS-785/01 TaxID=3021716 RepID=UPI00232E5766|nr:DNA repair protein RecO [Spirulina sp. CS-785/01]MDB9314455.1 DNA repair protein RecO [Spirulina sp. CS-785/01]
MSQSFKATGINLKTMPYGESDRLVTILTAQAGLVYAVAPGARKAKSRLRGRLELFVVNELLIVKGRSLDKIIQAETLESYPGLSRNLAKLATGQYWAEIVLAVGLSEQTQEDLYELLNEHLRRLDRLILNPNPTQSTPQILAHLVHGLYHLLAITGLAPQLQHCCLTGDLITPNPQGEKWRVSFSFDGGGLVNLPLPENTEITLNAHLNAKEVAGLQQLIYPELPSNLHPSDTMTWMGVERVLRNYSQYQLGKAIQSATLLDTLWIEDF